MDFDPQQLAQQLLDANAHGQEQLSLALIVLIFVFLARKFGPKIPGKVGAFFGSGYGGMALSFLIGQIGAVVTALKAGTPFSLRLVLSGVVVSLLGSGLHAQVKQVKQSRAKKNTVAALIFLMLLPLASGCAGKKYVVLYEGLAKVEKLNGDFDEQFPTINKAQLDAINKAATNYRAGEAVMLAWNAVADRLVKASEGTHASIKLVRDNVERIRKGLQDKKDYGKWLTLGVQIGLDFKNLLELSGVKLEVK